MSHKNIYTYLMMTPQNLYILLQPISHHFIVCAENVYTLLKTISHYIPSPPKMNTHNYNPYILKIFTQPLRLGSI